MTPALEPGTVLARHGRQLLVQIDAETPGSLRQAVTRGRRDDCCVGDRVRARRIGLDQAVVEDIDPRENCISRSDGGRTKLLAANVDQAAIVLSGDPPFSEPLLMRVLAVLASQQVAPLIIATKTDLPLAHARITERLDHYRSLGYPVLALSVVQAPEDSLAKLRPVLEGRCTLLLGQSGMGKSTLVNLLVPDAEQVTREISVALSTGRHTTSFCRMFPVALDWSARIIDSPGFQLFGIAHLSSSELMHALPDFVPWLGRCRFANCMHRNEPGCAIREAVERKELDGSRLRFYQELLDDTERPLR
ncbi:MAG: hypothetical protein RL322_2562 [Pseudomonadota bacterium]|jgi:ribosome biogenesis GTPase